MATRKSPSRLDSLLSELRKLEKARDQVEVRLVELRRKVGSGLKELRAQVRSITEAERARHRARRRS